MWDISLAQTTQHLAFCYRGAPPSKPLLPNPPKTLLPPKIFKKQRNNRNNSPLSATLNFLMQKARTVLSNAAGNAKPECCTCSQMQALQQNRRDNCRILIELSFLQHVADIGGAWLHVKTSSTSAAEQF